MKNELRQLIHDCPLLTPETVEHWLRSKPVDVAKPIALALANMSDEELLQLVRESEDAGQH
jgi:hypothetical protein